jgi:hypothetical protein
MASSSSSSSSGISFGGLLCIVFIVLKLTHYIDWSWVWVLCLLWIGLAIAAVFLFFGGLAILITSLFK